MTKKLRERREDDYLGPSRGLTKWFHRFMMLLLFPLRRPLLFILILLIMFLSPTFMGVRPAEVHLWYWSKIKNSSSQVGTIVVDKTKEYIPELPKVEMPSFKVATPGKETVPQPKVVDMPRKEVRRKMFEKARFAPVAIDLMDTQKAVSLPYAKPEEHPSASKPEPEEVTAAEQLHSVLSQKPQTEKTQPSRKKLALVYIDEPKSLSGKATVVNANEIVINGQSVFLYGIYVDPNTTRGQEGKIYLDKTISAQRVECEIKAFTYQGIATGICTLNGINLNRAMVEGGFSKNVALDEPVT